MWSPSPLLLLVAAKHLVLVCSPHETFCSPLHSISILGRRHKQSLVAWRFIFLFHAFVLVCLMFVRNEETYSGVFGLRCKFLKVAHCSINGWCLGPLFSPYPSIVLVLLILHSIVWSTLQFLHLNNFKYFMSHIGFGSSITEAYLWTICFG